MTTLSKEFFEEMEYLYVRQLDDRTWVGLTPLLFTTGLCLGLDEFGWKRRYCFKTSATAISELAKLKTIDDVPTGWVAKRPKDVED